MSSIGMSDGGLSCAESGPTSTYAIDGGAISAMHSEEGAGAAGLPKNQEFSLMLFVPLGLTRNDGLRCPDRHKGGAVVPECVRMGSGERECQCTEAVPARHPASPGGVPDRTASHVKLEHAERALAIGWPPTLQCEDAVVAVCTTERMCQDDTQSQGEAFGLQAQTLHRLKHLCWHDERFARRRALCS